MTIYSGCSIFRQAHTYFVGQVTFCWCVHGNSLFRQHAWLSYDVNGDKSTKGGAHRFLGIMRAVFRHPDIPERDTIISTSQDMYTKYTETTWNKQRKTPYRWHDETTGWYTWDLVTWKGESVNYGVGPGGMQHVVKWVGVSYVQKKHTRTQQKFLKPINQQTWSFNHQTKGSFMT